MLDPRAARAAAADMARWAFWVKLRDALDADRPEQARRLFPGWRLQHLAARAQRSLVEDELRRCFGDRYTDAGYRELVADTYRVGWRTHLEELLLGKLDAQSWMRWMRFEGQENLDAALAAGKGAIVLFPHVGNFMMMIASVSLAGYPYTQYAARGMAPAEIASAHPDTFGHSRWRVEARAARESNEDRLPARFITLETPIRHLYRRLEANEVVGIAFDGRIGKRFVPTPWLGRTALVNPGPYRLATSTGAAIVPTLCHTPEDGPDVCTFAPPIFPRGRSPEALLAAYLGEAAEPFVTRHAANYGLWLAHCRARADVDDHPFFIDYAPDDRYKRHMDRGSDG